MRLDDSIGFLINNTGRKLSQLLTTYFAPYDITTEQWVVLSRLGEEDGITQKDLAKRVEKDQTNVTRILDQLERKKLVKRIPNQEDRRSFLTYLTGEARNLIPKLSGIEEEVVNMALTNLSKEDLSHLKYLLFQIAKNCNQQE